MGVFLDDNFSRSIIEFLKIKDDIIGVEFEFFLELLKELEI